MYSLQLDDLQQLRHTGKALQAFPMNTAITFDFSEQENELDQTVQNLIQSWITFDDYKSEPHQVQTGTNVIASLNGNLRINGSLVDLNDAVINISSEFTYTMETQKSFTKLFNVQNTIFSIIILLTLLVFGFLFIIGQRIYKRKYYL